ncbi:hypothetical protein LJCM5344_04540 [Lactobacillus paragasseri]|nr:hypothetical protein LJCM5344_04540 [Lactobacillus paragasseri]
MNIMFCGDSHAEDGILITTLSLPKNTSTPLHFYILTMHAEGYTAFNQQAFRLIKKLLKEKDPNNTAELIDCTELFKKRTSTSKYGNTLYSICNATPFCGSTTTNS